jgi:RecT family
MSETTTPETRPLPAVRSSDDGGLDDIARMGKWLAAAESEARDPNSRGAAAALRLAFARELGLPLTAASEVHIIRGKLSLGALLLRALAEEQGYRIEKVDSDDAACTAVVWRGEEELGRTTWTIEQAQRRGLVKSGSGWEKNPDRMLWARAATDALRDFAPKVAVGLLVTEELDDLSEADADPAAVAQLGSPPASPAMEAFSRGEGPYPYPEGSGEPLLGEPEAEPEPEPPPEAEPWTDRDRRTIYAILGELDKRFTPPLVSGSEHVHYEDWKSVAVETVVKRYDKNALGDLSHDEALDLIKRMRARLKEEENQAADRAAEEAREVEREAEASGDDIPY